MLSDGTRGPEMKNIAAGEGVEVILEEGRFLPGVVEGLVGKTAGTTVTVPVTFPETIRDPKLAGLKVEFEIEILEVKNRIIPEIDQQFADDIRPGLTPEDIKKEVIDAVNSDAEERTKNNRNRALENALLEISTYYTLIHIYCKLYVYAYIQLISIWEGDSSPAPLGLFARLWKKGIGYAHTNFHPSKYTNEQHKLRSPNAGSWRRRVVSLP